MILALLGTAAVASAVTASADPRVVVQRGSLALILGVALTIVAVVMDSSPTLTSEESWPA